MRKNSLYINQINLLHFVEKQLVHDSEENTLNFSSNRADGSGETIVLTLGKIKLVAKIISHASTSSRFRF